jgi:hypothetical protein
MTANADRALVIASPWRIVYTDDTGPSDAVEKLAQGANLLSEITDPDAELATTKLPLRICFQEQLTTPICKNIQLTR